MLSEKFIEVNCETCQTPFQAVLKEVKRGNGRFCSLKCSATRHRPTQEPNCSCTQCGEPFYRNPTELKKSRSGLYFCSRACKDEAQKISSGHPEIQPYHYRTARPISGPMQVEVRKDGKQYPFIQVAEGFSIRAITMNANDKQELESILVELVPAPPQNCRAVQKPERSE